MCAWLWRIYKIKMKAIKTKYRYVLIIKTSLYIKNNKNVFFQYMDTANFAVPTFARDLILRILQYRLSHVTWYCEFCSTDFRTWLDTANFIFLWTWILTICQKSSLGKYESWRFVLTFVVDYSHYLFIKPRGNGRIQSRGVCRFRLELSRLLFDYW